VNRKLKIAIYSGSIPSTTFIENLIVSIAEKHCVFLFGKQQHRTNYVEKPIKAYPIYSNKFSNLFITKWRFFLLLLQYPKRVKILLRQLQQFNGLSSKYNWFIRYIPVLLYLPHVFHIQWAKDVAYWIFLKEELDVKIILSLRGAHINYSPISNKQLAESYKKNFPKIDAFHAVSDAIGIEAQKYGADLSRIKTIYSLISPSTLDLFKLPAMRKDSKLKILSVGRHHWKKGYSMALAACKILKEKNIPFEYTIVAGGKVPEELFVLQHQYNLDDDVIFETALPQAELFKKMQESDVLLLPSLEEGIANVVLEAMALGVPVISTNCGGMKEVVFPTKTGWIVPMLDEVAMAATIVDFKTTSLEKRVEVVLNAHSLIKENFDGNKNAAEFEALYQSLF
jgi:glycosyltransferase involved in cell wall biosynthesis